MTTEEQITSIVEILATADVTVPVYPNYTVNPSSYPYLFVSDGSVRYTDMDFNTYLVIRNYKISIVVQFEPNEASVRLAEAKLRELLNKVENVLKPVSSRNYGGWNDLKIISTSEPFNGADVSMTDDKVIREITIQIEDSESNQ